MTQKVITKDHDTADRKGRFAGILENPYISMFQRNLLDGGREAGLKKTIGHLNVESVLDIGCGLGEHSHICPRGYVGVDNSFPRVRFASGRYTLSRFVLADARNLPVKPGAFDMAMLIDTSHHLTDDQFLAILTQMRAAARKWVLVSDCVFYEGQNAISRFWYSMDRGATFRDRDTMLTIFSSCKGLKLERAGYFITFPGFYRHGVFLLKVV